MFSQLSASFNRFQGRFSYRQRFILFAFIFFLVIPLPSYWLIETQNFLLKGITTRVKGNSLQITLGALLNNVLKHEIVSLSQSRLGIPQNELIEDLENQILRDIEKLQQIDTSFSSGSASPFTTGFSIFIPEPLDFKPLIAAWKSLVFLPKPISSQKIIQTHQEIAEEAQRQLEKLGYAYELFLNSTVILQELTHLTLNILPEAQFIISKLFSLSESLRKDEKAVSQLLLQVGFLKSNIEAMNEGMQDSLERFGDESAFLSQTAIHSLLNYNQAVERLLDFMDNSKSGNLSDPFTSLNFSNLILESLNANELTRLLFIDTSQQILASYKMSYLWQKYFTLALIGISTLIILTFVFLKILSRHLLALLSHIEALERGNFSTSPYFNDRDEFGRIGRAFELVAQKMKVFLENLTALSQLVQESSLQTRLAINQQATVLVNQEESSLNIENSAKEIAFNARSIANKMTGFTSAFELADDATAGLLHVQGEMAQLAKVSTQIFDHLQNVDQKVKYIRDLINFMSELAEQTHLLSLNAAIESIPNSKVFKEITQNIELFAEKSSGSTNAIQEIISEVSLNTRQAAQKVENYLKEIKANVTRLTNVSQQLSEITRQVTDQTKQFHMIATVMAEQANDAEKIMVSIIDVSALSKENTHAIQDLQKSIDTLNESAVSLNDLMSNFKTNRT
ncbi:MAG: methyl-accepting chemotaxis protein [Parachlamydia sp.]|nr:MAG: methyl-accepting chemotaxis protein [Parachlamydia sp.]